MARRNQGGIILHIILSAVALYVAASIVPGIRFTGSVFELLIAGLLLGVLNAIVKPLLVFLSLPLIVLTLGIFYFIINAIILLLLAAIMSSLSIAGLGAALLGSIVIGLVNLLLHSFFYS